MSPSVPGGAATSSSVGMQVMGKREKGQWVTVPVAVWVSTTYGLMGWTTHVGHLERNGPFPQSG